MSAVIGICGNLRPESCTSMSVNAVLWGEAETSAHTQPLDLAEYVHVFAGRGQPGQVARLGRLH